MPNSYLRPPCRFEPELRDVSVWRSTLIISVLHKKVSDKNLKLVAKMGVPVGPDPSFPQSRRDCVSQVGVVWNSEVSVNGIGMSEEKEREATAARGTLAPTDPAEAMEDQI